MSSFVDESTECAICLGPLILSEQEQEMQEVEAEEMEEEENLVVKVVEVEVEGHHNQNLNHDENENTNNGEKKKKKQHQQHPHQYHKHKQQQQQKGVIKLPCGHKYHLECLIAQIQSVGSMLAKNEDQRLLFSGIQCAKCAQLFVGDDNEHKKKNKTNQEHDDDNDDYYYDDHPAFPKQLLRATDKLRTQVDTLILEHNLIEGEEEKKEEGNIHDNNDNENTHQHKIKIKRAALFREARRKYAFYLCHHCQKVYFGGTVACADGIPPPPTDGGGGDGDGGSSRNPSPVVEKRLCSACTPQAQHIQCCRHPFDHGPYLTWKCRYCCTPATHICYGGVHFCTDCHHKNSQRVAADNDSAAAHQQQQNQNQRRPALEAIPCPGESCHYPKPPTTTGIAQQSSHHKNGATQECEQVYSCSVCDSASNQNSNNTNLLEPGSRNLIINPNGALGLTGWTRPTNNNNRYRMWQVENRQTRRRHHDEDIVDTIDHAHNHSIPEEPLLFPTTTTATTPESTNSENENSGTTTTTTNHHRNPITTNFVSSFTDCVMMQTIDLRRVLQLEERNIITTTTTTHTTTRPAGNDDDETDTDDTIIPIEISARYTGRDDCPSVFLLQAVVSDHTTIPTEATASSTARARAIARTGNRQQHRQEERVTTGVLAAPPGNYWERTPPLVFRVSLHELQASCRTGHRPSVTVIVYGKDTQFWQGNFGSKVAEISVRILGNAEFLTSIVRPVDVDVPTPPSDNGGGGGGTRVAGPTLPVPIATANATMNRTHKMIVWDFLVPVVGFLILAWFAKQE